MKKTLATIGTVAVLAGGGTVVADRQIDPYTDQTDRVEMATVSDAPEAGVQKVEVMKDKPEVRFKKWNGEVDLGVTYNDVKTTGSRPMLSKEMQFNDTDQEVHTYPDGDNFEIDVILNKEPKSNVMTFTLDNYQNLDFFYQPPLNEEMASSTCTPTDCGGAHRPENVVGSYAVYYKDHANHIEGQTNYATGKAYHIFRPEIIDSAGTKVWGILNIATTTGILSVTIPQDFLDKAVYPVRHAAGLTFGYNTIPTTGYDYLVNYIAGYRWTAPTGISTVSSITAYVEPPYYSDGNIKGIITLESNLNIITNGVGGAKTIPKRQTGGQKTWYTSDFVTPPSLTATTDYDLAIVGDSNYVNVYYDTGTTNYGLLDTSNSYTTPTNPTDATRNNHEYGIYVTYTASAPASSYNNFTLKLGRQFIVGLGRAFIIK